MAARGRAAQHPHGEADRGAAVAAEGEAGQALAPGAPPPRRMGDARRAALRRCGRPRPGALLRLHLPPLIRRRPSTYYILVHFLLLLACLAARRVGS